MHSTDHEVPLTEAAQKLGISWQRAWRLVLTGRLTGRKIGGRWFVTTESLATVSTSEG
jgi:hypothetical protein